MKAQIGSYTVAKEWKVTRQTEVERTSELE